MPLNFVQIMCATYANYLRACATTMCATGEEQINAKPNCSFISLSASLRISPLGGETFFILIIIVFFFKTLTHRYRVL